MAVFQGPRCYHRLRRLVRGSSNFRIRISPWRAIDTLLDELERIPQVQAAYLVTGRYDLMVRVLARDMDHLKALAYEHFTNRPVISRFETSIIYEGREQPGVPVPDQEGQSAPSV